MRPVRVAVVDEHEIFRRGIVTCLADDPTIVVVADVPAGPLTEDADVVVVSPAVTGDLPELPLVVCGDHDGMRLDAPAGLVMAVLPRKVLAMPRSARMRASTGKAVMLRAIPMNNANAGKEAPGAA